MSREFEEKEQKLRTDNCFQQMSALEAELNELAGNLETNTVDQHMAWFYYGQLRGSRHTLFATAIYSIDPFKEEELHRRLSEFDKGCDDVFEVLLRRLS